MRNTFFANLFVTLLLSAASPAAELLVPSQYPTIQSGIDAAVDGDTVIIAPGTYTGEGNRDISFKGKPITVRSIDPNDLNVVAATIIDCNGVPYRGSRGFIFETNETADSVLSGLTIINGAAWSEAWNGGAIYCRAASPTISRCVLSSNVAEQGGGIACRDSNAIISDCIITGNVVSGCGSGGGGIWCMDSNVQIERCDIIHNTSRDRGGDAIMSDGGKCRILECEIAGDARSPYGGLVCIRRFCEGRIAGCTITSQAEPSIYVEDSNCVINDCTIVHGEYGILSSRESNVMVTRCTISPASEAAVNGVYADIGGNLSISDSNISGHSAEGVWFEGNDLTVRDSTIANNGGGIMVFSGRRAELAGSSILANSPSGGATLQTDSVLVTGCIVKGNSRVGSNIYDGGGLHLRTRQFKIDRCLIVNNISSRRGGGAYVTGTGEIADSEIADNIASDQGGGICGGRNIIVTGCSVRNNIVSSASGLSKGGGIYSMGPATIENSYISGNSAGEGGGAYISGAVRNSVVVGNKAKQWGLVVYAPHIPDANGILANCTVAANRATQSARAGIHASRGDVNNCIVWGNDGPVLLPGQQTDDQYGSVQYSCVQGGFAGEGNIDAEPRFVMPGYWDANGTPDDTSDDFWVEGDYRLKWDSPCIDAGDPNFIAGPNEMDLDGNLRVIDGDEDGNAIVDMGAYEYIPPIEARVCIMPNVLNLKSNGRWIICTIRLPQPYDVEEIEANSVFIQEEIAAQRVLVTGQTASVLFDRQAVEAILHPGRVELLITGELINSRQFEGSDTIKVISGPEKRGGRK